MLPCISKRIVLKYSVVAVVVAYSSKTHESMIEATTTTLFKMTLCSSTQQYIHFIIDHLFTVVCKTKSGYNGGPSKNKKCAFTNMAILEFLQVFVPTSLKESRRKNVFGVVFSHKNAKSYSLSDFEPKTVKDPLANQMLRS